MPLLLNRPPANATSTVHACWLVFAVASQPVTRADESIACKERLLADAPAKWSEYYSFAKRLQGNWSLIHRDRPSGKIIEQSRREIKQCGSCSLDIFQKLGPEQHTGTALVKNSKYAFQLKRTAARSPWVLIGLDTKLEDGASKALEIPPDAVARTGCVHLVILNRFLPDLLKDPEFELKTALPLLRDGVEHVRIEFDYQPKRIENNPARGGWALLDPRRYWVMRQYEVEAQWPDGKGTIAGAYEYKDSETGLPVPKRFVRVHKALSNVSGPVDHEYVLEYDLYERESVPESEFTLSAFGLPEPEGLGGARWYLWIILTGVVLVASAVVLRVRARTVQARRV